MNSLSHKKMYNTWLRPLHFRGSLCYIQIIFKSEDFYWESETKGPAKTAGQIQSFLTWIVFITSRTPCAVMVYFKELCHGKPLKILKRRFTRKISRLTCSSSGVCSTHHSWLSQQKFNTYPWDIMYLFIWPKLLYLI